MRAARIFHTLTAAVGLLAIVVQLVLVFVGSKVLISEPLGLGPRLGQFFGYFTIQSNLLAAFTALSLALRPDRDGPVWRVVRIDAVIGMTVTGLVHWFLLRPLLHLEGLAWATDKLLHVVAPLLIVVGWLVFGPRPRLTLRVLGLALIWPILWLVVILLQAQATGWYPYPFLNLGVRGGAAVAATCLGVTVLFLVLEALALLGDRRLPRPPGARPSAPAADPAGSMSGREQGVGRAG